MRRSSTSPEGESPGQPFVPRVLESLKNIICHSNAFINEWVLLWISKKSSMKSKFGSLISIIIWVILKEWTVKLFLKCLHNIFEFLSTFRKFSRIMVWMRVLVLGIEWERSRPYPQPGSRCQRWTCRDLHREILFSEADCLTQDLCTYFILQLSHQGLGAFFFGFTDACCYYLLK